MEILFDPTLIYSMLVFGLWLGVTGFFVPGTGLLEIGSATLLIAAFWLMTNMATNWLSVILILVGVAAFLLVPLVDLRYARFAQFGLILQGLGGVFLFKGTMPNPIMIALTLLIAFAYNHFLLLPIKQEMKSKPVTGNEISDLIGAHGRVFAPVKPPKTGTAQINGELWTIRSNAPLKKGDVVQVLDTHGLEVLVERVKDKYLPDEEEAIEPTYQNKNGAKSETTLQ